MPEDGFKNRNLMPAEKVEWLTSTDAQKPALIIKALIARVPDAFDGFSEKEKTGIAEATRLACSPLKILDIYNVLRYCQGSIYYGVYFHKDMRWGYNIEQMQDLSIPAKTRIDRLLKQCSSIYVKCFVSDTRKSFIGKAVRRLIDTHFPTYLPAEINDPTKFVEGWCRILWPKFIDIMPDHYFQRMAMPMKNFCDQHELGTWELALCLAAAAVSGQFFMLDPRYTKFCSMLLDQKGPQGRDKVLNIVAAAQTYLQSIYSHWGEN